MSEIKIRSKRKLLQILLFHYPGGNNNEPFAGLCRAITYLKDNHIITHYESSRLSSVIHEHIKVSSIWNNIFHNTITRDNESGGFFWKPGYNKPRIKYINYLLKIYKNE